jgi:glycosyltransferase involved in cell wall biosynthesis
VFRRLSNQLGDDFLLLIGSDLPGSKVRSAEDLSGINVQRLNTRFFSLHGRIIPWHVGLVTALKAYAPDVIVCEGESHFLGYLQAIYYRLVHQRRVALVHWCFITLPGRNNRRKDIAGRVKEFFRAFFDAHLVYSSFSRSCLLDLGVSAEKIFVATNVSDVDAFLQRSNQRPDKREIRRRLNLPDQFMVIYSGTLDANKRPDLVVELATIADPERYNFVIVGNGPLSAVLREQVTQRRLTNVVFAGRVSEPAEYYLAADVLIVPGRGGIVISEAMACGLPVIVHQADGTEFDLVQPGVNGFRVVDATALHFLSALEELRHDEASAKLMAGVSRSLIETTFNTDRMVSALLQAAKFAKDLTRSNH